MVERSINIEKIPALDIQRLVKGFYIEEGVKVSAEQFRSKANDPQLTIGADCTTEQRVLTVSYKALNCSKMMSYDIKIDIVPSNLGIGKGFRFYFICPKSGARAEKLYYCFETNLFVHRKAQMRRIYYPLELYSKQDRLFLRSQKNEKKLLRTFLQIKKHKYRGKPTKLNCSIEALVGKKGLLDRLIYDWTLKQGPK